MPEDAWVKIRSWHISVPHKDYETLRRTLCGRLTASDPTPDRPADEKTCETCLRIKVGR